ncbi:MAG: hypothetical protein OIF48_06560 [Silicimonas sp.]|nr:hypothetical protein [Silicimonas sp.]
MSFDFPFCYCHMGKMMWNDMETAPLDGTAVCLLVASIGADGLPFDEVEAVGRWDGGDWRRLGSHQILNRPVAWLPRGAVGGKVVEVDHGMSLFDPGRSWSSDRI